MEETTRFVFATVTGKKPIASLWKEKVGQIHGGAVDIEISQGFHPFLVNFTACFTFYRLLHLFVCSTIFKRFLPVRGIFLLLRAPMVGRLLIPSVRDQFNPGFQFMSHLLILSLLQRNHVPIAWVL